MSDIKIDSNVVKITTGQKTSIKEQPALEKADLPQFSIINSGKPDAKELETQLWQLGIESIKPRVAEQDVTSVKILPDIPKPTLKDKILRPIREMAYKTCTYSFKGYVDIKSIFPALGSKKIGPYSDGECSSYEEQSSIPVPDMLRIYLCLDPNSFPVSKFRPQSISDKADITYYSVKPWSEVLGISETQDYIENSLIKSSYLWPTETLCKLLRLKPGEITYIDANHYNSFIFITKVDLGSRLLSLGRDGKGVYLSVYDKWDFKPDGGFYKKYEGGLSQWIERMAMSIIGKPIYIYDRYYIPEKDIKSELERREKEDR